MRRRSGIDWSLSPCCGEKPRNVSGIIVCRGCNRPIQVRDKPPRLARFEQHEREFNREYDQWEDRARAEVPLHEPGRLIGHKGE